MSAAQVAGHFGEWVQGRLGPDGPVALVTVPCPALMARAVRLGDGPWSVDCAAGPVPVDRVAAFLEGLGAAPGRFSLHLDMPPGGGAGASTAGLLALARAAGVAAGDAPALAAACLRAEGATDPLMLPAPDAVLWAPRQARGLRTLPPLPGAEIIGGFHGAPQATVPGDTAFPDIADLAARLERPLSLPELAALASASATRCTALRGPDRDPTPELARHLGALGHLRAHTGSARGLIFAPGTVPAGAAEALRAAGFARIVQFRTGASAA